MSHTPTPWAVDEGFVYAGEFKLADCHVSSEMDSDEMSDNAAFIVRAVNNHDAMTSILRECHRALGGEHIPGLPSRIRAAITAAEGK